MRTITKALAVAAAVACTMGLPMAHAEGTMDAEKFVKMCDKDKDGMVSKAEMMKMMEQMFDKQDTKKTGKLDKAQVDAFLKELIKSGS
jgi:Ca2+-binding EF-hand superfamily protein